MRKFNIKSIVLGIGIGIIITSIISMIYAAGRDIKRDLSNEEIISRARELGMVKPDVVKGVEATPGQNGDNGKVNKTTESSNKDLQTTKIGD